MEAPVEKSSTEQNENQNSDDFLRVHDGVGAYSTHSYIDSGEAGNSGGFGEEKISIPAEQAQGLLISKGCQGGGAAKMLVYRKIEVGEKGVGK